ncbi:chorismate mutase [Mucidula mucida]|nr:chorismate mutase [Mucidula mucida]
MQSNLTVGNPLSLDRIRSVLTRLEDTIIFSLIERAQFGHNPRIYQRGAFKELQEVGFTGSWLEWFLKETESFHGLPNSQLNSNKYTSPDEYPFSSDLPEPILPALAFPALLHPNTVNRAKGIVGDDEFEDDGNYGSAATIDIEILQAISKRVHYGKFVSESKFLENPAAFIPHIQNPNRQALEDLITKPEVERRLLMRLAKKAATYAQDFASDGTQVPVNDGKINAYSKIDVDGVVDLYESYIIPLTKEVEVDYLLQRLNGLKEEEIEALSKRSSS